MALLLPKGAAHRHHLAKLGEIGSHLFLRDLAVLVEEGEAIIAEDIHLHVAVELDEADLAGRRRHMAHRRPVDPHDRRRRT